KIFEAIKPQIIPVVEVEEIDGCEVIALKFSGDDVPYSAFGKYYIRIADEDRELTPFELRKIMIGREYEENWENRSTDQTVDDADDRTVRAFYDSATSCGRLPEIGYDKRKILDRLGVLNGDRLTNAGVRLFSSRKPVTLMMAVFATGSKDTFLDINRTEGNIFELIDAAVTYVAKGGVGDRERARGAVVFDAEIHLPLLVLVQHGGNGHHGRVQFPGGFLEFCVFVFSHHPAGLPSRTFILYHVWRNKSRVWRNKWRNKFTVPREFRIANFLIFRLVFALLV
ncbi:MAG: hypothetical protein J6U38_05560, partial [Clostridia bacterium]|nr:hypothetical protein [Clostridia bacterium]